MKQTSMKPSIRLIFYPEMQRVIDHYASLPLYSGETIVPIRDAEASVAPGDKVIVLGRHGNCHQYDLAHIKLLRERGVVPGHEDTTVVVFDWHEDFDSDVSGTELTSASWAYLGLEENYYSNLYVVGANPSGYNEINPYLHYADSGEKEFKPPTGGTWRQIDRICLFPAMPCYAFFRLLPEWSATVVENESITECFAPDGGGFVVAELKGMEEITYRNRRKSVVVSIDLDVLKRSVVKTVCPQGITDVDRLVSHLRRVRESGPVDAVLICGLTEAEEEQDEVSLATVSTLLAEARSLLST
ncbi:MAG: hypothetical protein Q7T82_09555 [Armatimonadota bacterium]|nr:hypothetical protein [Armatimonadota bacterium]